MTKTGLIGAGRVGAALLRARPAFDRCGLSLVALAGRGPARPARLAAELGHGLVALSPVELVSRVDLVFLAVPDDLVASLAAALPFRQGQGVVHLAGALDLGVLSAAAERGAQVGVFHPLQAFTEAAAAAAWSGITIGIEANPALEPTLLALCRALGAEPLALAGVDRASYHAAAVLASNYVVALHAAAARAFELAGLPPTAALRALVPLTLGAAQNLAAEPPVDESTPSAEGAALVRALTGPVARGDIATVTRHLEALSAAPQLAALYRALGHELLSLPLEISQDLRARLSVLLAP